MLETVVKQSSSIESFKKEELLKIYETMLTVRFIDEKGMLLQRQGKIGFYLPNFGEEAWQVGSVYYLQEDDIIVPSYRALGTALWRGIELEKIFHNLFGNALDNAKGRQMPVHYSFKEINFLSISSPIGTQLTQAVGIAYACKYKKTNNIVVTYSGDGGTSSNDFHTALNFAGVLKVPVVFFVNNNQWAITVPVKKQTASESIAVKAKAYGFEGFKVDGNNVFEVLKIAKYAIDKARQGKGPTLIECFTYRMGPHSTSDDPRRYVPQEELEKWKKKDPIEHLKQILIENEFITEEEDRKIKEGIAKQVNEAAEKAAKTNKPSLNTLIEDVYEKIPSRLQKELVEVEKAIE